MRQTLCILGACVLLTSCGAKPESGPPSYKEVKLQKLVIFVHDKKLQGHFEIVNEKSQPLAMSGMMTLQACLESKVNVEGQAAFDVKAVIWKGTYPVKTTDFQWVYYHSFLTDDEFVCNFRVALEQFKSPPPGGRYLIVKFSFKPDVYPTPIEAERKVWIPKE